MGPIQRQIFKAQIETKSTKQAKRNILDQLIFKNMVILRDATIDHEDAYCLLINPTSEIYRRGSAHASISMFTSPGVRGRAPHAGANLCNSPINPPYSPMMRLWNRLRASG